MLGAFNKFAVARCGGIVVARVDGFRAPLGGGSKSSFYLTKSACIDLISAHSIVGWTGFGKKAASDPLWVSQLDRTVASNHGSLHSLRDVFNAVRKLQSIRVLGWFRTPTFALVTIRLVLDLWTPVVGLG
jgi:hypothetical protein